jgi:hypothetical protein
VPSPAVVRHLSLLELPPVLGDALKSDRSPRTPHELRNLHADSPRQV